MKAYIYQEPLKPDNRTEEEKNRDKEKAIKAFKNLMFFKNWLDINGTHKYH